VATEISANQGRHAIRAPESCRINKKIAVQTNGKRTKLGFLTTLHKKNHQTSEQERTMPIVARCCTLLLAGAALCAAQ